jgi:hypothetical protein
MEFRPNVLAVLKQLAAPQIAALGEEQVYRRMQGHLRHMKDQWAACRPVDYSDELRRLAFLCSHVPVNADARAWGMERFCYPITHFMARKLRENGVLRVWALGGGPGSELFAVCRQLIRAKNELPEIVAGGAPPRVEFTAYDLERGWQPVFDQMALQMNTILANDAADVRFRLAPAPRLLLRPEGPLLPGEPPDLYLMSYVLSENEKRLPDCIAPTVQVAPKDAVFVMTDFVDPEFKIFKFGQALLGHIGLTVRYPRPEQGAFDTFYEFNLPMRENVQGMGPFCAGIEACNDWNLRRNSDVFWLAAVKEFPHPDFPGD